MALCGVILLAFAALLPEKSPHKTVVFSLGHNGQIFVLFAAKYYAKFTCYHSTTGKTTPCDHVNARVQYITGATSRHFFDKIS